MEETKDRFTDDKNVGNTVAGSFLAVVSVYSLWQADNHSRRSGRWKNNACAEYSGETIKGEGLDSEMKLSEPINVIYQSAEDGLADTVKPRIGAGRGRL